MSDLCSARSPGVRVPSLCVRAARHQEIASTVGGTTERLLSDNYTGTCT